MLVVVMAVVVVVVEVEEEVGIGGRRLVGSCRPGSLGPWALGLGPLGGVLQRTRGGKRYWMIVCHMECTGRRGKRIQIMP